MVKSDVKERDCKSAGTAFEGSSPSRPTLKTLCDMKTSQVATLVDWLYAEAWLTFSQACFLSGWNADQMAEIIRENGVDLDDAGRIEKQSLYEFQEALLDVLNLAPPIA